MRLESTDSVLTSGLKKHRVLQLPIAHADGNFTAEASTLTELEARGQVILRYCDAHGQVTDESNPNGSLANIAGVRNARGNVVRTHAHPERALEALLSSTDGEPLLRAFLS